MVTKTQTTTFDLEESTMRKIIQEEIQNCMRKKVREIINEKLSNSEKQISQMVAEAMDKVLPRDIEDRAVQSYDLVYDYLANNDGVNPLENFPFVAALDPTCMDDAICARMAISPVKDNSFPKVPIHINKRVNDCADERVHGCTCEPKMQFYAPRSAVDSTTGIVHRDAPTTKQYTGKSLNCRAECKVPSTSPYIITANLDENDLSNPEDDFKDYVMKNMAVGDSPNDGLPHAIPLSSLKRPQYEQMIFGKKTAAYIPVFKQFKEATEGDPSEIIGEFYNNKLKNLCVVMNGSCDCSEYANSRKSGVLPIDCVHTKFASSRRPQPVNKN